MGRLIETMIEELKDGSLISYLLTPYAILTPINVILFIFGFPLWAIIEDYVQTYIIVMTIYVITTLR